MPALVQIMAWRRPGDKPLSEPMMVSLPTHICVTRPQWVKRKDNLGKVIQIYIITTIGLSTVFTLPKHWSQRLFHEYHQWNWYILDSWYTHLHRIYHCIVVKVSGYRHANRLLSIAWLFDDDMARFIFWMMLSDLQKRIWYKLRMFIKALS